MIDALFGSKTRVKLLHLFLNNPGKAFYVREITRIIDEQINSVRRELSNMLTVGIIKSNNVDHKLYYEVNQRYDHYLPLREIFSDNAHSDRQITAADTSLDWKVRLDDLGNIRIAILSGMFVSGSAGSVDLLLVGNPTKTKLATLMKNLEKQEGREINYSIMKYDEFYYRLSVKDKFIFELLSTNHTVLRDDDHIIGSK